MFFAQTIQQSSTWANLGLIGIGAIIASFIGMIGTLVANRQREESERKNWLREKRIEAFSNLSKVLLSFFNKNSNNGQLQLVQNVNEMLFQISETVLLVESDEVRKRLYKFADTYDEFIDLLQQIRKEKRRPTTEENRIGDKLIRKLEKEGKELVRELSLILLKSK